MNLIALHDEHGHILAAVRAKHGYNGPIPVAGEGTQVSTVPLAAAHHDVDFTELVEAHRIDVHSGTLVPHHPHQSK